MACIYVVCARGVYIVCVWHCQSEGGEWERLWEKGGGGEISCWQVLGVEWGRHSWRRRPTGRRGSFTCSSSHSQLPPREPWTQSHTQVSLFCGLYRVDPVVAADPPLALCFRHRQVKADLAPRIWLIWDQPSRKMAVQAPCEKGGEVWR